MPGLVLSAPTHGAVDDHGDVELATAMLPRLVPFHDRRTVRGTRSALATRDDVAARTLRSAQLIWVDLDAMERSAEAWKIAACQDRSVDPARDRLHYD